ncbi:hypothetical protein BRC68_14660 [Halobacteriales archaeon QH_6_64_20]|nr:MAG: hypothetical protein BRC68_14660 [Halobacteriales archaeon QH_6_64_20]
MVLIETMTATRPEFVRRSAGNTRSAIQAETGSEIEVEVGTGIETEAGVGVEIGIGVSAHSAEVTS